MQRLQRFLHRELDQARLRDDERMAGQGVRPRWVPEELASFDEIELALGLDDERDLVLTLALEEGRVARMQLGWAPAGDDDEDMRAFTEEQLGAALDLRGEQVVSLLEYLIGE